MIKPLLTKFILLAVMLIAGYDAGGISTAIADQDLGRALVRQHCTRCHVVADINPYGGIGSTPSFEAMKTLSDWRERFEIFYLLPPHPSVIRIDGISEERPENLPAFSHEILLTIDEHEAILSYVDGLEKK
jgi:mono/diheme cytochrome c family protein